MGCHRTTPRLLFLQPFNLFQPLRVSPTLIYGDYWKKKIGCGLSNLWGSKNRLWSLEPIIGGSNVYEHLRVKSPVVFTHLSVCLKVQQPFNNIYGKNEDQVQRSLSTNTQSNFFSFSLSSTFATWWFGLMCISSVRQPFPTTLSPVLPPLWYVPQLYRWSFRRYQWRGGDHLSQ